MKPKQLKKMYDNGMNIHKFFREDKETEYNSKEAIEFSYDLQAGTYVDLMLDEKINNHIEIYTKEIAKIISSFSDVSSIMEAGVGEATTLSGVVKNIDKNIKAYGFDLSWSRLAFANKWLNDNKIRNVQLCLGDLFNIPFMDNSIDVVYTSHSIEPNGGFEKEIISELYRVTNKYLILLEPAYELATQEARKRMDENGYCKNLAGVSKELGCDVEVHRLFVSSSNPLNPTAITIIKKNNTNNEIKNVFRCPEFGGEVTEGEGVWYGSESLFAYPIIGGVPCLRKGDGVFASRYLDFAK